MSVRSFSTAVAKNKRRRELEEQKRALYGIAPGKRIGLDEYARLKRDYEAERRDNILKGKIITAKDNEIKDLEAQNKKLTKAYEEKVSENLTKDKLIAGLKARLAELGVNVQEPQAAGGEGGPHLEEPANMPPKNSVNSSVPPSKNPLSAPKPKSNRKPSDKPSGGQPGHPGTTRLRSEHPDERRGCDPMLVCPICGNPIKREGLHEGEVHQVIDIPFCAKPTITEYISMEGCCDSCGHTVKGDFPKEARGPVTFGPNIRSTVVYLSNYLAVPYNKIKQFFHDWYGIDMSEGTIGNILNEAGKKGEKTCEDIKSAIFASRKGGADESPTGEGRWMWTLQNPEATLLVMSHSRSYVELQKIGTAQQWAVFTLVSDRFASYFKAEVGIGNHQVCLVHLIRNLNFTDEVFVNDPWSGMVRELLREAIHVRNEGNYGEKIRDEMQARLTALLEMDPVYVRQDGRMTALDALKKNIKKVEEYVFQFLIDPTLPATNNDSEKALRYCKAKLKIGGCFRSDQGAIDYANVGSIIQTAIKNKANPKDTLFCLMTDQPIAFIEALKEKYGIMASDADDQSWDPPETGD